VTKATESKRRIAWGRYLLVFFVAAWMFVLGVLVGRGTAPVKFDTQALQKELAELRDAMMQKEREEVEKAMRGEDEKAPLEFYEALKTNRPDTSVSIPTVLPTDPKSAPEEAAPRHKSRPVLMPKPAKVSLKTASASAPAAEAPATTTGGMTIQVAAMKDGTAAERTVANLKNDGYPAYLSRIVIPGKGLWFRVRVGNYDNPEQAKADVERLTHDNQKPILVKNR